MNENLAVLRMVSDVSNDVKVTCLQVFQAEQKIKRRCAAATGMCKPSSDCTVPLQFCKASFCSLLATGLFMVLPLLSAPVVSTALVLHSHIKDNDTMALDHIIMHGTTGNSPIFYIAHMRDLQACASMRA